MNHAPSDLDLEGLADKEIMLLQADQRPTPQTRRGRILIVEDQGIVATDIERCLEDSGFEVTAIATSMEDAIRAVSDSRPDLVLMDIRIQGAADGIEAAGRLHRDFGLPVIYLTAHDDRDTLERAKRTEPMAFLIKPFKPAELTSAVEIALDRSRVEQALRRQADLLDQSQEPIFTWELDGAISYWNRGAEALYGYSPLEAVGRPVGELLPAARESNEEALEIALKRDRRWSGELGRKTKDGREIVVETRLVIVEEGAGRKTVLETDRDITERKRTEVEIWRLNRELQARVSELLTVNQELDSFNYSISHDLRAPLRHINAYAKILLEQPGMGLPGQARNYVERVGQSAARMARMVDELLELSRTFRQEPARQVTELKSLVEDVLLELKAEVEDREIEWLIGDLPFADCDPTLTRQVFANLLANAVKFTRPRKPAVIEVGQAWSGGQTVLFVRDNGVGFNMKYADKLFGVFQRLHRREDFEGTGVGLVTVQRIVHKHGGRIFAEAELENGATFYFTLEPPRHSPNVEPTPGLGGKG